MPFVDGIALAVAATLYGDRRITSMYRIDFKKITQQHIQEIKNQTILEELSNAQGSIVLTDCLANQEHGGRDILRALENQGFRGEFIIYIRHDKWGNKVEPGTEYEWYCGRQTRNLFGKKYNQDDIKTLTLQGRIRDIEIWHSATVDDKGCIKVAFEDALLLLSTRGVHFESKHPLSNYKEVSSDSTPVRKVRQGEPYENVERRLQHFWLYEEVPEDMYDDLPSLVKQPELKKIEQGGKKYPPLYPKDEKDQE